MLAVTNQLASDVLLIGVDEAARQLSLSPWTIRAWAQKGLIRSLKVGSRRMIPIAEVVRIDEGGFSKDYGEEEEIVDCL